MQKLDIKQFHQTNCSFLFKGQTLLHHQHTRLIVEVKKMPNSYKSGPNPKSKTKCKTTDYNIHFRCDLK